MSLVVISRGAALAVRFVWPRWGARRSPVADKLTWDEIKRQYPDERVALIDEDWPDDQGLPLAGVVFAHSPDHARLIEM